MEEKSIFERAAEATAKLARNNINILDVKYDADGDIVGIAFEYGWKITPVSTKWTRAFMEPHMEAASQRVALIAAYNELLDLVRDIRGYLEG